MKLQQQRGQLKGVLLLLCWQVTEAGLTEPHVSGRVHLLFAPLLDSLPRHAGRGRAALCQRCHHIPWTTQHCELASQRQQRLLTACRCLPGVIDSRRACSVWQMSAARSCGDNASPPALQGALSACVQAVSGVHASSCVGRHRQCTRRVQTWASHCYAAHLAICSRCCLRELWRRLHRCRRLPPLMQQRWTCPGPWQAASQLRCESWTCAHICMHLACLPSRGASSLSRLCQACCGAAPKGLFGRSLGGSSLHASILLSPAVCAQATAAVSMPGAHLTDLDTLCLGCCPSKAMGLAEGTLTRESDWCLR